MLQTAAGSTSGNRITLIAVHGNGGGGFRFALVAERIARDIHFVAPDLPGFSDVVGRPPLPTLRAYADWIAALVAATPEPRVLLGHGIGGAFVLEMLQRHRALVRGVILHAPVGADLRTRRLPALMRPRLMRWVATQSLSSPVLRPIWRRRFFRAPVPAHLDRQFFVNYRHCAAFASMFDMITARWFDSLKPVAVPAVLLWGGQERVLNASHAAAFREVLPQATTVVEEAWDHFPMLDAPASYAARVAALARTFA